ncbi:MAG: hypothetical protein SVY53_01120 [Chloroflexota bacterium]|nr:hypothetical protein [Chloroflexota bacterium]
MFWPAEGGAKRKGESPLWTSLPLIQISCNRWALPTLLYSESCLNRIDERSKKGKRSNSKKRLA